MTATETETDDDPRVSDRDELQLNDAIEDAAASAVLIRRRYRLRIGERLLRRDLGECLRLIREGEFSRKVGR